MSSDREKSKLEMIRIRKRKSREKMAEYIEQRCNIKCSKNMIQDYEEGTTTIPIKVLIAYSELGNCLPSWILSEDDLEAEIRNAYFVELDLTGELYCYDIESLVSEAFKKYQKENALTYEDIGYEMSVAGSSVGKYVRKTRRRYNKDDVIEKVFTELGMSLADLDEFLAKEEYKTIFAMLGEKAKRTTDDIKLNLKELESLL
ncbi:hypothetical protein [Fusicatenibacter saccharivorans]|uniref:hypothetical protein n=1 Tax=Fusicatenibacter saccharivorans TaxID=1150298 RepID=UPI0022E2DD0A|nr:hypothetical protein [Fusicatenibacter saccharivorans]